MQFNGPDLEAIYSRFALRADMPGELRALCNEIERLRGVLGQIATFSRPGAPMAIARGLAHEALYATVVDGNHGGRR